MRIIIIYADKVIDIDNKALLFASPKIPYNYVPKDDEQSGYFCVFTESFLSKDKSGVILETLPIFHPGGYPILNISDEDYIELEQLFQKMDKELSSDYPFKFDLIRAYVFGFIVLIASPPRTSFDDRSNSPRPRRRTPLPAPIEQALQKVLSLYVVISESAHP